MKKAFALIAILVCNQLLANNSVELKQKSPLIIGDSVIIKSNILAENRQLNIYLPNSYSKNKDKKYPVIYLLDGSMDEDFLHIVGLVQFGSFSWIKMLPESIVVGIANVDRRRDLTFATQVERDKTDFPTAGHSDKFINFIQNELQPFIKENYQTNDSKTIIGQSLGGLLASQILFIKPDLFNNYIIISPSLWWNNESLLKEKPQEYQSQKSIYIAVGKEGKVMERTAKALYTKLKDLKKTNTTLFFNFLEKQNHGDALHLAVYDAFEKIFISKPKFTQ